MDESRTQAIELLQRFADRTGLASAGPPRRYLWTDAFAVCTLHGLVDATGDPRHGELALRLVDQVHGVLGRHRADDARTGWISGLSETDGASHPTRGGLRIGKPLPERGADEPFDERLEWDRDGQYFHYLTKWMHALDRTSRATGQPLFTTWARELAYVAHRRFVHAARPGGRPRMYWKMSIDLSRPVVASMGQHDPLDGFVTAWQLEAAAPGSEPSLRAALDDFASMLDARGLATADPLGIGGLLTDAYRLAQIAPHDPPAARLVEAVLAAALAGLQHWGEGPDLGAPAEHRLAFRELGLAIGLAAIDAPVWSAIDPGVRNRLEQLRPYVRLRTDIHRFWLEPRHRRAESWLGHEDINDVMLAASLAPEGFLLLAQRPAASRATS